MSRVDINGTTMSGEGGVVFGREVSEGPAAVRAGIPFDVTVYTVTGDPYCWKPSRTRVTTTRTTVTLQVYDQTVVEANFVCTLVGTYTPRTDQVVFEDVGAAEVVVKGVVYDFQKEQYVGREARFPVVVTE